MANFSCYSPLGPADLGPWLEIVKSALSLNSQVSVTGNFSGKSSFLAKSLALKSLIAFSFSAASRADTGQILSRLHRIEETRTRIIQCTETTEAVMMCTVHIVVVFLLSYTAWVFTKRLGR